MNPQRFKPLVEEAHRKWLSAAFGGVTHQANGIDLRAETFAIELKARMREFHLKSGAVRHCHEQFTLHDEQYAVFQKIYGSRLALYFCFLRYSLARPVKSLSSQQHDVEGLISDREAWFVPFAFVDSYSVSIGTRVPYRYVPFRDVVTYAREHDYVTLPCLDAPLHVPHGSPLEWALDPTSIPPSDPLDDLPF